jgi:hypothetical protein
MVSFLNFSFLFPCRSSLNKHSQLQVVICVLYIIFHVSAPVIGYFGLRVGK